MPHHHYEIDDDVGSGSRTALEDTKTGDLWETKDARADTQTTFYESDIRSLNVSPQRKRRLRRMLRRQEGEQPGEEYSEDYDNREQQNRQEWKRRMVTTYGAQLGLTSAQKKRTLHLILDILEINEFGYYSVEQVILATINLVAREDGRWIEDERPFQQFVMEVGIQTNDGNADLDSLRTLRQMVADRVPSHK